MSEIESKVKELRQLLSLIEEAQQEAEDIRDFIKTQMGSCEERRAGEYRPVETVRIDTAVLKATLSDVAAQFSKVSTVRRFCIA